VLRKGLTDADAEVREEATVSLHLIGADLRMDKAARLETQVQRCPDDLAVRGLLLGYFFGRQFHFESERAICQQHILWVITNAPGSELAGCPLCELDSRLDGDRYTEARDLWLRHVAANPTNVAVLGNAANFLMLEDKELGERLLRTCQALEPDEPYWAEQLGHLYQRESPYASSEEAQRELGAKALAELELARRQAIDEQERFHLCKEVARAAFTAGVYDLARRYAEEMVNGSTRPEFADLAGEAIHHGNIILGLLALRAGDVEGAKRQLIQAGKTPGSAPLMSFGPNMLLARDLLQRREKEAVLEYLRLCSLFWKTDDQRIDQWIYTVQKGGITDFGRNLCH
jgi:hypothetical protein